MPDATAKLPFLITIDTEGDNLWARRPGAPTVANAAYLPRFQALCEQFGFKPTYLTNWEMSQAPAFVSMARAAIARGAAEVGCHIHAWDSPPYVALSEADHRHHPFLIEYPTEVLREKVRVQTAQLEDQFGVKMRSHRAGRWAMDSRYVEALDAHGYEVDCSVTPGVDWRGNHGAPGGAGGSNYTDFPTTPYFISTTDIKQAGQSNVLEVPMTTRMSWLRRHAGWSYRTPLLSKVAYRCMPPVYWLRPQRGNLASMLRLVKREGARAPYLQFILHSSEFMPGGSPYFPREEDVEQLYADLSILFRTLAHSHRGYTMAEFGQAWRAAHPILASAA